MGDLLEGEEGEGLGEKRGVRSVATFDPDPNIVSGSAFGGKVKWTINSTDPSADA